jgi:hypothetical protein
MQPARYSADEDLSSEVNKAPGLEDRYARWQLAVRRSGTAGLLAVVCHPPGTLCPTALKVILAIRSVAAGAGRKHDRGDWVGHPAERRRSLFGGEPHSGLVPGGSGRWAGSSLDRDVLYKGTMTQREPFVFISRPKDR